LGLLLVLFSVFAATYLVVGYFALESGRELRIEQETTARADEIAHQIELARTNQAEGSDNLALTRLEWVLAQDPGNEEALTLRQQLLEAEAQPTEPPPTAAVEQTPNATGVADDSEAGTQLAAILRLVAAEDWEAALSQLLAFQHNFPDYERGETDQLLYDAYLNLGLSYINTEKIEIGLNYFAQAERLGNLPQEARDYRSWADLYFQAVAYSGVNWDVAAGYWRDLCSVAPFFQDSCDRYDQALVGYGDQFAFNLDWCPAVDAYQVAWNRRPSELLDSKIAQAIQGCASATAVPITNTNSISGTVPITNTEAPEEPGG
jgi:tetratricopeptide (TPR) repeat protein